MENTVMGMPPMQFISWLFMLVMFFAMASLFLIKQSIKGVITGKVICVFITRARKIEFMTLPEEAGVIEAPPHHRFAQGQSRVYFVNRKFALHGQFPPFIWKLFQETGSWGVWEEGDSQPLLPSDEAPFVSPEMVRSLINQNVIALLVKRVEEQVGSLKGAIGSHPWYLWALWIGTFLFSGIGLWLLLNILNVMLKGME